MIQDHVLIYRSDCGQGSDNRVEAKDQGGRDNGPNPKIPPISQ